ncbi:MAG: hypothetical protein WCG01_02280 [bacterium]
MRNKNCPQIKILLHQLLAKQDMIAVELDELSLTNFERSNVDKVYDTFQETSNLINKIKELMPFRDLIETEKAKLDEFFGFSIDVPNPPAEITKDMVEAWQKQQFELHYLPNVKMSNDREFPGWTKKPNNLFYDSVNFGSLSIDSDEVKSGWVLIDGRQKPYGQNFNAHSYENDCFKDALAKLEKSGQIKTKNTGSRYDISFDELKQVEVMTLLAEVLAVSPDNVSLPRAIDFNILGNLHYQDWDNTENREWFSDSLIDDDRHLCGGNSDAGGLSDIRVVDSNFRDKMLGFRLMVRF